MLIYFDNAATTKPRGEAVSAMLRAARDNYGNPSSAHFIGRAARDELDAARNYAAAALGASPDEVLFTSGGTEANNWAVFQAAKASKRRGKHIICSAIEHDSVLNPVRRLGEKDWEITYLPPDERGIVPADAFNAALRDDTAFASIMLVNNETGAVNPVAEYAKEIKRRKLGTILHTDAVQGFCKIPFTANALGADLLTVSGHKIHGVKGAGALYIRRGTKLQANLLGGGQERALRAGTEAVPAIAAFGEAARLGAAERAETAARVSEIREFICSQLRTAIPDALFIGGGSPFILSLSLPGHKSEVLMSYLEREGICVSNSAACKKGARSRVLEAMRLRNDVIGGVLRISFSRESTLEEAAFFVNRLENASKTLLKPL